MCKRERGGHPAQVARDGDSPRYAKKRRTTMMVKAHAKRDEARVRGWACAKQEAALLSPKTALTATCGGCVTCTSTGVRRDISRSVYLWCCSCARRCRGRPPCWQLLRAECAPVRLGSSAQRWSAAVGCSGARAHIRKRCISTRRSMNPKKSVSDSGFTESSTNTDHRTVRRRGPCCLWPR